MKAQKYIFISYTQKDFVIASELATELITFGYDVWMYTPTPDDSNGILVLGQWWLTVTTAVKECALFFVVMTPESEVSRITIRETYLAESLGKPIVAWHPRGYVWPNFPLNICLDLSFDEPISLQKGLQMLLEPSADNRGTNVSHKTQVPMDAQVDLKIYHEYPPRPLGPTEIEAMTSSITTRTHLEDNQWCYIPTGKVMLNHQNRPIERVVEAFEIGKYPITYEQYEAFILEGYQNPQYWSQSGWEWKSVRRHPYLWNDPAYHRLNHPVIGVSWFEAIAFCNWYSSKNKGSFTLPTELQRLRAAAGGCDFAYPWGETFISECCNTFESGKRQTTPVNLYRNGVSVFGVYDLTGNVWEWCLNKWQSSQDTTLEGISRRVIRGGSWHERGVVGRNSARFYEAPYERINDLGFRMVHIL